MEDNNMLKVLLHYGIIDNSSLMFQSTFKLVCPLHNDVNASMLIDLTKDSFYCFGCQERGNSFDLFSKIEHKYFNNNMTEIQLLIYFYRCINSDKVKSFVKDTFIRDNAIIKDESYYKQKLVEAIDYYFTLPQINWSQYNGVEIVDYLTHKRGLSKDLLNVIGAKVNYNSQYPVIFPIMDNTEFKGWVCRTTDKEVEKKRKYLYNTGFVRQNTLVGEYTHNCIPFICEGYFDRIKLKQFGARNSGAIFGWKISDTQVKKLKQKGINTVISALDNDEYGIKGTEVLRQHFNVIRMQFPNGCKDVGEMDYKTFNQSMYVTKYVHDKQLQQTYNNKQFGGIKQWQ